MKYLKKLTASNKKIKEKSIFERKVVGFGLKLDMSEVCDVCGGRQRET